MFVIGSYKYYDVTPRSLLQPFHNLGDPTLTRVFFFFFGKFAQFVAIKKKELYIL
jgi:hypothetical protein